MEYAIGVAFNDFAILAADSRSSRSIITLKGDVDKMFSLSKHTLVAVCGEPGDAVNFTEFIQQNMQLYEIRNGYELSPYATANFTRKHLAEALRSRSPYNVNMLIAGYDSASGPKLYYMDYLATLVEVPYAVHGHGGFVTLAILDSQYDPSMNVEDAVGLLRKCMAELKKRFVVSLDRFTVRIVNKEGIEKLADLV